MFQYDNLGRLHKSTYGGSSVYEIKEHKTKNRYALKLIGPLTNQLNKAMFRREVDSLYKLNQYDNIVKIIHSETGTFEGQDDMGALVLEFIEGQSLEGLFFGDESQLYKYNLCVQLIDAVQNAHRNDILHRDIKPSNIMLCKNNNKVKIIDFGISKIKSIIEKETITPVISNNYCAPEVAKGKSATELSDIYSVGAVIFRILYDQEPISLSHIVKVIQESSLLDDVKKLLISMLEEEPENRLQDLEFAKKCLSDVSQGLIKKQIKINFEIDEQLLDSLKHSNEVENNMSYAKIMGGFLTEEFENPYGVYYENEKRFEFIGKCLIIKCVCDNEDFFTVTDIYRLPIDILHNLKKKYMKIEGSFYFTRLFDKEVGYGVRLIINQLKDHNVEIKSYLNKRQKFSDLFSKWREYLNDCIDNTKNRNPKISYSSYEIKDGKLYLKLNQYIGNEIDNLDDNIGYAFDFIKNNRTYNIFVGTFSYSVVDEDSTIIAIDLTKGLNIGELKSYLNSNNELKEDYIYKITSYKKQLMAIDKLDKDDYKSKDLKDILLAIKSPSQEQLLSELNYSSNKLDQSQKKAIEISLLSDSVSLIQGPPGTGKTRCN